MQPSPELTDQELLRLCKVTLDENPQGRLLYQQGKSVLGFLIGKFTRKTQGQYCSNLPRIQEAFIALLESPNTPSSPPTLLQPATTLPRYSNTPPPEKS